MKLVRDPIQTGIYYIIGLIVVSLLFKFFPIEQQTLINYITLAGTFTSIYGLIIAYTQIISVKETSEATRNAVEDSNRRIMQIISVSDLSRALKLVHEIQNYLLVEKLESAIIRMKDLKVILIHLKYNSDLKNLTESEEYQQYIADVSINMNNITTVLTGSKTGISINKIIRDLDHIESALGDFEGKLKFGVS